MVGINGKEIVDILFDIIDPITGCIYTQPIRGSDGYTYEKCVFDSVMKLGLRPCSPYTHEQMIGGVEDAELMSRIKIFLRENPEYNINPGDPKFARLHEPYCGPYLDIKTHLKCCLKQKALINFIRMILANHTLNLSITMDIMLDMGNMVREISETYYVNSFLPLIELYMPLIKKLQP